MLSNLLIRSQKNAACKKFFLGSDNWSSDDDTNDKKAEVVSPGKQSL